MYLDLGCRQDLGSSFTPLVHSLRALERIKLSAPFIFPDVVTALSHLPSLAVVSLNTCNPGGGDVLPAIDTGGFPSLTGITCRAYHLSSLNLAGFLQSLCHGSYLRELNVGIIRYETSSDIELFFTAVSTLSHLEVLSLAIPFHTGHEFEFTLDPITFSTLRSLLRCRSLKSFRLKTSSPLLLTDVEAVHLASGWTQIHSLSLNTSHHLVGELTLSTLIPFITHCPNLRNLGIHINPSIIPPHNPLKVFRRLEKLTIGTVESNYDEGELALFLSKITPPSCVVESFPKRPMPTPQIQECARKLERVLQLIPTFRKVHAEHRARLRQLSEQLQQATGGVSVVPR